MVVVDVDQARNDLSEMVDRVQDGVRITITSRNCNAVLISEEDYNSLVEALYLLSDPHMSGDLDRTRGTPMSEMEVWIQRSRTDRPGRTAEHGPKSDIVPSLSGRTGSNHSWAPRAVDISDNISDVIKTSERRKDDSVMTMTMM